MRDECEMKSLVCWDDPSTRPTGQSGQVSLAKRSALLQEKEIRLYGEYIGRQGWCLRRGIVKVKDEGGMMKDENRREMS
jgi:hypothetical protein